MRRPLFAVVFSVSLLLGAAAFILWGWSYHSSDAFSRDWHQEKSLTLGFEGLGWSNGQMFIRRRIMTATERDKFNLISKDWDRVEHLYPETKGAAGWGWWIFDYDSVNFPQTTIAWDDEPSLQLMVSERAITFPIWVLVLGGFANSDLEPDARIIPQSAPTTANRALPDVLVRPHGQYQRHLPRVRDAGREGTRRETACVKQSIRG